ncbi:MAG: alpha/beta fold hydrolase [Actinomycetota bacterium]
MSLAVNRWGPADAAPVLAIHGVRNIGARFRRVAQEALPHRRVLAPDLRGHGASTWDPPWDAETHVADLLELLDREGVGAVDVVGHSFGGLLATRLAAAAPGRVASLTLLDPAVALDPAVCVESALNDLEGRGRAASFADLDEARAAWLAMRPPEGRWAVDEDLAAFLERGGDGRLRFRYSRLAAIAAWGEMACPPVPLTGFTGAVVLVEALRDAFVTPALRRRLARDVGARLVERPVDAGHMLFWDAFDALAAVLREALPA